MCAAKMESGNVDFIPVVAYRQNRKKWKFLIPADLISGLTSGYVEANERVFFQFMKSILDKPSEYKDVVEVKCIGCDKFAIPNHEGNRYYCGGGPRCVP